MYGFAPDMNLSFFRGDELTQIRLGANDTQLAFASGILITTACRMTLVREQFTLVSDDPRFLGPALHDFLAESVEDVAWELSGTLRLKFRGGTVTIEDDAAPHYESYQIYRGKDVIVV